MTTKTTKRAKRIRRTKEQIHERRTVKILERLEGHLMAIEEELEALNEYESDRDVDATYATLNLSSDVEVAVDECKEACIQAYYKYSQAGGKS